MSMQNVEGFDELMTGLLTLEANLRKRGKDLEAQDAGQARQAIGLAAAEQRLREDRQATAEEAAQIEEVRARAEQLLNPPAPPADAATEEVPAPDTEVVVETPEGDPTQEQNVHVHTNVFITFINWVRGFTLLQWVLALIGMLVGLRIGLVTDDFGDATGTARTVIQVVWVTGLTILGFGLGGWIGSLIERRRTNGH